jgi:hypothetical protein
MYEYSIQRYRHWYTKLLRLYPRSYYQRFGEGMQQTFSDLLRERAGEGRELFGFALWVFVETSAGVIKENLNYMNVLKNNVVRALLGATLALLVPITASFFLSGWEWSTNDYVFAWVVFALIALAYTFGTARASGTEYKLAVGAMLTGVFFLVWVTAAVEIIGDDNPTNLLYGLVLITLIIGATVARLEALAMSHVLFAAAFIQFMVPMVGLMIWPPSSTMSWTPGVPHVFFLNAFWVATFVVSGLLFRQASERSKK